MSKLAAKISVGLIVFAAVAFAEGADVQKLYREGNLAYRNKDYAAAIEKYLKCVESGGVSPELFYNLGNAYFRAGSLAQAILWYERARILSPQDPDIRHNLKFARSLMQDKVMSIYRGVFLRWFIGLLEAFSFRTFWWLMLILSSLATLATVYYILQLRAGWLAIVLWILFALVLGGWYVKGNRLWERNLGIVMVPKLDARSEPSGDAEIVFTVHAGTRVAIKEHRLGWYRIILENGSSGWVPDSTVARVIPENPSQLVWKGRGGG